MNLSRRDFLGAVGIATACSTIAKAEPARSASNKIRVGVIGTGVRGKYLIGNLPPSVTVGTICDCATMRIASVMEPKGEFAKVLAYFTHSNAANCATYQDFRTLLDRAKNKDKLDAVIIATPDHHHALAAILAMQAGLDVYLTDERRYWPVEMRYSDGVELQFVHGPDFISFHGELGTLRMRRNYFETDPPELIKNGPRAESAELWQGSGHVARPHLENWLAAIRTEASLNAPVEAGHRTVTICHLANIARELNRTLRWNPKSELFVADEEANRLLDRPRRKGFELPAV